MEPSPLSAAISAFVFFRLSSKQPAASEMTALRRQPQVTLWWTRRSIYAVDFSGEIVTAPFPSAPNSAGTLSVAAKRSGSDGRTLAMIYGQYCTLVELKLDAFHAAAAQRCWKRRPSGMLRRNSKGCSLGKNHTWNQWQEIYSFLKSKSHFIW